MGDLSSQSSAKTPSRGLTSEKLTGVFSSLAPTP